MHDIPVTCSGIIVRRSAFGLIGCNQPCFGVLHRSGSGSGNRMCSCDGHFCGTGIDESAASAVLRMKDESAAVRQLSMRVTMQLML